MGLELPLVDTILTVEGLTHSLAGLVAIDGLTFSLREGELLGITGPNGAIRPYRLFGTEHFRAALRRAACR